MKLKRLVLIPLTVFLLAGCDVHKQISSVDKIVQSFTDYSNEKDKDRYDTDSDKAQNSEDNQTDYVKIKEELSEKDFSSGMDITYVVNNNHSLLDKETWENSHIDYSPLDDLNRTQTAIAYLDKTNVGASEGRSGQTWKPTGWHNQPKEIDGERVSPMNRGHLIAYTLSFNLNDDGVYTKGADGSLDNPKNLFSQTAYSNQRTFQKYERQVRDALNQDKKVIYRVEPIYRDSELMARGLWAQAKSTDGELDFNVYLFNVQPGLVFNYATGESKIDKNMTVLDEVK